MNEKVIRGFNPDLENIENSKEFAQLYEGFRFDFFKKLEIPDGWVVNGNIPDKIWDEVNTIVIPLSPGGFNAETISEAEEDLSELEDRFGERPVMMIYRDDETKHGWAVRPVLLSDLENNNPNKLLAESIIEEGNGNTLAGDMKRAAFMILTGALDTR